LLPFEVLITNQKKSKETISIAAEKSLNPNINLLLEMLMVVTL